MSEIERETATVKATSHEVQHHKNKTRYYWSKWESWMGLAALLVSSVTVFLWISQLKANKINSDMYVAQTRPWVMLNDIRPSSLSSDDEAGIAFWAYLSVKNVGHSPAQNVSVSGSLLINNNGLDPINPMPDQGMADVCREARGPFTIPGHVLFPDQTRNVWETTPEGFIIPAERVWATRAARINFPYKHNKNVERAKAQAEELSEFPFYGALFFVGCINYRSADNSTLYQTSFMFDLSLKPDGGGFPLLSGEPFKDGSPTRDPNDPDVWVAHARRMQRVVPGDQIRIEAPLYGMFAN